MAKIKFGIEGLYDIRTAKKLSEFNLNYFVFDQRTSSPQFIQNHVLIDLLKTQNFLNNKIVLKFDTDKSFMIDHAVNNILSQTNIGREQLEVWLYSFNDWITNASLSFKLLYLPENSPSKVLNTSHFSGFIFRASDFEVSSQNKTILLLQLLQNRKFDHVCTVAPFDSIPHALIDYLEIDTLILDVNSDVEICYRNLDYDKLSECFKNLFKNAKTLNF